VFCDDIVFFRYVSRCSLPRIDPTAFTFTSRFCFSQDRVRLVWIQTNQSSSCQLWPWLRRLGVTTSEKPQQQRRETDGSSKARRPRFLHSFRPLFPRRFCATNPPARQRRVCRGAAGAKLTSLSFQKGALYELRP